MISTAEHINTSALHRYLYNNHAVVFYPRGDLLKPYEHQKIQYNVMQYNAIQYDAIPFT